MQKGETMGMPERLSTATSADDLGWKAGTIKDVDLVAALSATTNLGSDMHRAKDYDLFALRRAVLLLTKKAIKAGQTNRRPLSRAMAQTMAVMAMMERCMPNCRTCHGARVVIVGDLKVECHICGGVGVHRYSDRERARLCGVREWEPWQSRYAIVLDLAINHDTAQKDASIHLGKDA